MTRQKSHYKSESNLPRRRLDPDSRRAQLLEHAISAFADAGIERAAHADVAGRANVSTPTVFKYFPSREALVDAVLTEVERTFEELKNELAKLEAPTPKLFHGLADALSELCLQRPDLMKVTLAWSVAFTPIRARYLTFTAQLTRRTLPITHPNAINDADKRLIFSAANAIISMHFDGTDPVARQDFVNRICELMKLGRSEDAANAQ